MAPLAEVDGMAAEASVHLDERTTAPQSRYGRTQVGIGFIVLAIGCLLVFAIPALAV